MGRKKNPDLYAVFSYIRTHPNEAAEYFKRENERKKKEWEKQLKRSSFKDLMEM